MGLSAFQTLHQILSIQYLRSLQADSTDCFRKVSPPVEHEHQRPNPSLRADSTDSLKRSEVPLPLESANQRHKASLLILAQAYFCVPKQT